MLIWLSLMASCIIGELLLSRKPYAQGLLLLVAVFLAGVALSDNAKRQVAFPFNGKGPMTYEAVVTAEPQVRGKTLLCDLALVSIGGRPLGKAINVKAHILRDTLTNDWRRIKLGMGIEARSAMEPLRNYRKGNFDYARWLHCHGFSASTFIYVTEWRTARVSLKPMATMERLRLKAMGMRQSLVARLNLGNDGRRQSAIVAAMVLGDKQALDQDTKDAFSVSGASHVLALSGLHLSIIYFVLTLLMGRRHKRSWLTQAIILLSLWLYVLLVGYGSQHNALCHNAVNLFGMFGRRKGEVIGQHPMLGSHLPDRGQSAVRVGLGIPTVIPCRVVNRGALSPHKPLVAQGRQAYRYQHG